MTLLDVLMKYGTYTSSVGTYTIAEGGIVVDGINSYVDTIDVTISLGQKRIWRSKEKFIFWCDQLGLGHTDIRIGKDNVFN